jgi:hypothetical protein
MVLFGASMDLVRIKRVGCGQSLLTSAHDLNAANTFPSIFQPG